MQRSMGRILLELNLISHGSVQSWNASGSSVPDSREPTALGFQEDPAYWQQRYERAIHKEPVRQEAESVLEAWKRRPPVETTGETQSELEQRIVHDGQGWTVAQVAIHCRTTEKMVRRARAKAGAHPETGVLGRKPIQRNDRAEKAAQMRSEGLSYRSIGLFLGVNAATVERDLQARQLVPA